MQYAPLLLLSISLTSCTLLMPEKTMVGGPVWLVSQAEIHRAISVARAADADLITAPIERVVVDSRDRLIIYFYRQGEYTYGFLRREGGQWRYIYVDPLLSTLVT